MFSLSFIVHRNILSADCCIHYKDISDVIDVIQLKCDFSSIHIALLSENVPRYHFKITSSSEFFIPSSFSNFDLPYACTLNENKISFEIPFAKGDDFSTCFRFQVADTKLFPVPYRKSSVNLKDYIEQKIKTSIPYDLSCSNCNHQLATVEFEKIKEFWDVSCSESWFCHQVTGLDANLFSQKCLYFDDVSFYISKTLISATDCKCGKKLNVIRPAPNGLVRLFFGTVLFRSSSNMLQGDFIFDKTVSLLSMRSIIEKCQARPLFSKVLLEAKTPEKDVCLLLLIPNEQVAHFSLQGPLEDLPLEKDLTLELAYKFLYFLGTEEDENVKLWYYDFAVDYYQVSHQMITTVINSLESSSKSLGVKQSSVDGFLCGYLF